MPAWDRCESVAREFDEDTGRELVLICDLGRHEIPGDAGVEHHDPRLGVYWRSDEDGPGYDGEPEC